MSVFSALSKSCLAIAITQALVAPVQGAEIIVNVSGDNSASDSNCTLREALVSAETNPGNTISGCVSGEPEGFDIIRFDSSVFPNGSTTNSISLTSPLPQITSKVSILGSGRTGLTVDANNTGRVFHFYQTTATLSNLRVQGGRTIGGSAGIAASESVVTINNCTVTNNFAEFVGGGIGVGSNGTLSVNNSTISSNTTLGSGGGIVVTYNAVLNLNNSTVSSNSATNGAGIHVNLRSDASINNSTITGNSTVFSDEAEYAYAKSGGGILATFDSTVNLRNSIVAGNLGQELGVEILPFGESEVATHGVNILGSNALTNEESFYLFTPNSENIIATSDGNQATTLASIIAPLADNGGNTQTHALVENSPAIDKGQNSLCAAFPIRNLDQRGESRLMGSACDIGSFESAGELRLVDESTIFVIPLENKKGVIFEL